MLGAMSGCNIHSDNLVYFKASDSTGKSVSKEFNSLPKALSFSREKSDWRHKTISLKKGNYFISNTINLNNEDSGLKIEGENKNDVHLFGGRKITNWEKGNSNFWIASLPKVKSGEWFFRSLMINGKYVERSRYPENGYFKHESVFNGRWMSTVKGGWEVAPTEAELTQMKFNENDIKEDFDINSAELTVFHEWDETLVGIKSIDFENHVLTTSIKTGHPFGAFSANKYVIWNTLKGMTKPGQWYLNKEKGELVYWPLPNDDMETIEVVAPVLDNVFKIEDAKNITIRNLSIHSANTPMKIGSFAAKLFDGAVSLNNSQSCTFENLNVSAVTGWGLKLFGEEITVKNCNIHNVGAGGIYVIGNNAVIENNLIHDVGNIYYSAIALYVGVTDPNAKDEWEYGKNKTNALISHNEIKNAPYVGIGIGGRNHTIEYNKISNVMQKLADGSGIYATFCKNLLMYGNYISDLPIDKQRSISAYYLDELCDSSTVANNISYKISTPLHCHMTNDNTIKNNYFIAERPIKITLPKCKRISFENNIFISDVSVRFVHKNGIAHLNGNLFDVPEDQIFESENSRDEELIKLSLNRSNRISKSMVEINDSKAVLKKESPAWSMGIKPLDSLQVGLVKKNNMLFRE